jgi:diketogulonate reductase-like aldo/keto reductase
LVWSPLAGGYLSGKYTVQNSEAATGRRTRLNFPPIDPIKTAPIIIELQKIATELASTPAQVTLAWILGRREVTSVIIGARTPAPAARRQSERTTTGSFGHARKRLDHVSQADIPCPQWMQQFHDKDRVLS